MWAGALSNEKPLVRSAETVSMVEGNTGSAALVKALAGSAVSKNPGTHVSLARGPERPPRYHGA